MKLEVKRFIKAPDFTIGEFYIDGKLAYYTCEDTVRSGPKIKGKTAIPTGIYQVIIDFSNRFQKFLPHVLDVPNFEGIRIHSGNTAADTEGCILIGMQKTANGVGLSRAAMDDFMPKLSAGIAAGRVMLTIGDKS